ncbi:MULTISPECIES: NAD(P) transhydrogenase subunit alpha [Azospirillum]|uniref:proton-translocating NAD(P)(+) transhydrogenase n=15 Tax=Azospirillaceae TaxID=2829815 RepID=A0A560BWG8_AZOBR|nr:MULTISPECIES: NAD(P) transhydrogenase subunit alpha [Azospirillum]AIB11873.1 NAD(P) transhydrogenase subunit alpha part 2 [Azospirillum argentinense]ALJ35170.1 NAD(P) transhydrogenase subunit alpha part 2 [Azospirillum brasilense]AWJ82968.1 NAD(P) transhydrogenase subunit alpha part 2 [Azospirillum sp. TSH58]AWJ89957.1 NAD(P) transhydrogenase subunit alpha part 2 [Azospirillum baldaniorum]EZQ08750.1 NAD(P) transhydrogenase subunit alpha part 2 [Azospirillum argentinense]
MEHPDPASQIEAFRHSLLTLTNQTAELQVQVAQMTHAMPIPAPVLDAASHGNFFITGLTVFVLACFVGYYVVWRVTPALHSPLMAVTNAVSSVIIVGALIAAGPAGFGFSKIMGFLAVILASVNIFGGFLVTQRMLSMFKKKGK